MVLFSSCLYRCLGSLLVLVMNIGSLFSVSVWVGVFVVIWNFSCRLVCIVLLLGMGMLVVVSVVGVLKYLVLVSFSGYSVMLCVV